MAKTKAKQTKKSTLPVDNGLMSMPKPQKMSKEDEERERRYRAEEDLRTMTRAKEIQEDKQRMKAMQALAKENLKAAKC